MLNVGILSWSCDLTFHRHPWLLVGLMLRLLSWNSLPPGGTSVCLQH